MVKYEASMSAYLIRGAAIVSVDPGIGNLSRGDILVKDDVIAAIGPDLVVEDVVVASISTRKP